MVGPGLSEYSKENRKYGKFVSRFRAYVDGWKNTQKRIESVSAFKHTAHIIILNTQKRIESIFKSFSNNIIIVIMNTQKRIER